VVICGVFVVYSWLFSRIFIFNVSMKLFDIVEKVDMVEGVETVDKG